MITRLISELFRRPKHPHTSNDAGEVDSSSQPGKIKPVHIVQKGPHEVRYATPNQLTAWRVHTLFTKEPDTIAWIDSFSPNEVLVDIGANVGMYSIWAAKSRGVRVYAFEPEAQNYALINQNIYMNKLSSRVTAYCIAVSDKTQFDRLYLSGFSAGGSCHSFGEEVDFNLQETKANFEQGAYSATLDYLIEVGAITTPNHIKVDVDGLEHKVIAGAQQLLQNQNLKSILVEINTHLDSHLKALDTLKIHGFTWSEEQVQQARRATGTFEGIGNYVCIRS